jgi:hypothetical protein
MTPQLTDPRPARRRRRRSYSYVPSRTTVEARIGRLRRRDLAAAVPPRVCECGGPVGIDEEGDLHCIACGRVKP